MKNLMKFKNFLLAAFVLFAHAVLLHKLYQVQFLVKMVPYREQLLLSRGQIMVQQLISMEISPIEASSSDVLVVSFVGFPLKK